MANHLKDHRIKQSMSQQALGHKLGIHKDYVSMIERGARTPGFKLAKRMADFFDTTVDELFFCSGNE